MSEVKVYHEVLLDGVFTLADYRIFDAHHATIMRGLLESKCCIPFSNVISLYDPYTIEYDPTKISKGTNAHECYVVRSLINYCSLSTAMFVIPLSDLMQQINNYIKTTAQEGAEETFEFLKWYDVKDYHKHRFVFTY